MSTFVVPIDPALPDQEFTTTLDGGSYTIRARWNARAAAWFLGLSDRDSDPICSGVRVVLDWPLCGRSTDPRRPPGLLMAIDTAGTAVDPGETDLGERVKLLYCEAADLVPVVAAIAEDRHLRGEKILT